MFSDPDEGIASLGPDELQTELAGSEPPMIVDVREPFEFEESHIPGALLLPLGEFGQSELPFDETRKVVVVCRSGRRSGLAVQALMAHGYGRVRNLRGGMLAWRGPVE